MKLCLIVVLCVATTCTSGSLLKKTYPKVPRIPPDSLLNVGDPGEPLFLTPYIKDGNIQEGQNAALVNLSESDVVSYSGYLTVNETYNSNMYFWFFPSEFKPDDAPVLLWLQGGPGASSLYALFVENGPFVVNPNLTLSRRPTSWTLTHNVIYIDNPVGTGFSFTDSEQGYATNEVDVGINLYNALLQFFTLFPQLQDNDFYVTGESYAGKYVPAISYRIHVENPTAELKINYKGMAIGDGLCDPATMMDYGDYLYYVGMLDQNEREFFSQVQDEIVNHINQEEYLKAFWGFDILLNDDIIKRASYFTNFTGFTTYYNYLETSEPLSDNLFGLFVQLPSTRKAIHVGNLTYHTGNTVEEHLLNDIMQSIKPWFEELLNAGYKILLYSGQVDIIVAHPLTQNFIESLEWNGANEYRNTTKAIWRVKGDIAGYAKNAGNFTYVIVRSAGHMVPHDQPIWAYDMLARFIYNKPF